jgi:hypothetical protein
MFDIDLKPTFTRRVKVTIPSGATTVEQSFLATFEALDVPEIEAFNIESSEGSKAFLERAFIGADELALGGKPIEFTPDVRDQLIAKPWARRGLVRAYLDGFKEASTGN